VKAPLAALLLCLALAIAGCGGDDSSGDAVAGSAESQFHDGDGDGPAPPVTLPVGAPPRKLIVEDLVIGRGPVARPEDELKVYFTSFRYLTGDHFETIWKPDKPFEFKLNGKEVIPGWVKGLPGMRVGGRRYLVVPGQLAARGGISPFEDPDESTLVYVVELLAVNPGTASSSRLDSRKPMPVQSTVAAARRKKPAVVPPDGPPPKRLVVKDLIVGKGPTVEKGDELTVEYLSVKYLTGKQWSGSWDPSKPPFVFELGAREVLPGWEKGLLGMKAGGRRELVVPPDLVFPSGAPPGAGPEETLVYNVDLLRVE
jgi:peptidylprolyl isomerase